LLLTTVITVRRIALDYEKMKSTILTTDLPILLAEHAELLLNYIPQHEELEALNKHKPNKERYFPTVAPVAID
jgi:hypothetical protein